MTGCPWTTCRCGFELEPRIVLASGRAKCEALLDAHKLRCPVYLEWRSEMLATIAPAHPVREP